MRAGNQIPNYKETQNYVKNVMALYSGLKPPEPPAAVTPESRYPHSRVRPAIRGGALNRGNLPPNAPVSPPADGREDRNQLNLQPCTPWKRRFHGCGAPSN